MSVFSCVMCSGSESRNSWSVGKRRGGLRRFAISARITTGGSAVPRDWASADSLVNRCFVRSAGVSGGGARDSVSHPP